MCSSDEITVVVKLKSNTSTNLMQASAVDNQTLVTWTLWQVIVHLHVSKVLHLLDGLWLSILLSVVEWVILLWHLQSKHWIANQDTEGHKHTEEGCDLGPLELIMHVGHWVWQLVVHVLINVTNGMEEVMVEVVGIHIVVMDECSSVLLLWLEIEPHIIPVSWPHLTVWVSCMSESAWEWLWEGL